jgi:hypothetical protein
MELPNYELIRYPSGQTVITRLAVTDTGVPTSSGPRDVVGVYANEQEAQNALNRLAEADPRRHAGR